MQGWTVKIFEQIAGSPRLYQAIAPFLLKRETYRALGGPVVTDDSAIWAVLYGEEKVLGFAVMKPGEEGRAHLQYLHMESGEEKITGFRTLIKELVGKYSTVNELWTVDNVNREEMWLKLGFSREKQKRGAWYYYTRAV